MGRRPSYSDPEDPQPGADPPTEGEALILPEEFGRPQDDHGRLDRVDAPQSLDVSNRTLPRVDSLDDIATISASELETMNDQGALVYQGDPLLGDPSDPEQSFGIGSLNEAFGVDLVSLVGNFANRDASAISETKAMLNGKSFLVNKAMARLLAPGVESEESTALSSPEVWGSEGLGVVGLETGNNRGKVEALGSVRTYMEGLGVPKTTSVIRGDWNNPENP